VCDSSEPDSYLVLFVTLQDMMEALTTQNSELRTMLIKATEVKSHKHSDKQNGELAVNPRDEIVSRQRRGSVFALFGTVCEG
jgi:hypothetical protein